MIIKVCGLIDENNLKEIVNLDIDMIGLNFYKPSKRYLAEQKTQICNYVPGRIRKVGVFVNERIEKVLELTDKYELDLVQLHGTESTNFAKEVQKKTKVIKVFGIEEGMDIDNATSQYDFCDYLLFDTKSIQHGGSGIKFNWKTLDSYTGKTPFILSGGIGPSDHEEIRNINHPAFKGVDINSKFESEPGIKIVKEVSLFINKMRA